ncbi:MAG: membrane dipeptidase [Rhodospirillales bacterium]|nr:membrane dipeptidase [Rhodospirillales bacterium]
MTVPAAIAWDAHTCLPIAQNADLNLLDRHRAAGFRYVSVNVGMDMTPIADIMLCLAQFRRSIAAHPDCLVLADSLAMVEEAAASGRLAVAFDLEGAKPLLGESAMVQLFADLGVRQMHLIYNRGNAVGGGCHDPQDPGLSDFGRGVILAMADAGVVLDVSHAGVRTSLEMIEASPHPVVFSHANVRALYNHPRNLTDCQIDACAARGGVIGVTAHSLLTGKTLNSAETVAAHIEYIAARVGAAHVGLGLDYCYETDIASLSDDLDIEYWWPARWGYREPGHVAGPPDLLGPLAALLQRRGYDEEMLAAILGGNFLRVATAVWPTRWST